MATARQSCEEEEEAKLRDLGRKISELRTAIKELFEQARPINVKLEKISQQERKCVDELNRLTAEKHNREKHQQIVPRIIELEAELKRVNCRNETLEREKETLRRTNSTCAATINNLKQSLDKGTKNSRLQSRKITELNAKISALQHSRSADIPATPESENSDRATELQEQLHETNERLCQTEDELKETRQRLSDVQERLTVAEQVTAATQQRELQESDNSEQLQLELTPQHQPTTRTGLNFFQTMQLEFSRRCSRC